MEVFPGDDCGAGAIDGWITEVINAGLVLEYESEGQRYWQVTGWDKHQKVDRPTVKFRGPFDEGSTIIRRGLAMESNGVESNGIIHPIVPQGTSGGEKAKPRFSKPTVDEVLAYCLDRKNGIDPQAFVDFYDSKGWKIGTTPMRDWKAAVRNWEKRRSKNASEGPKQKEPEPRWI
jgi:hypothetical protein